MGYNDPVGDEHRQNQLFPERNQGLSESFTRLFGENATIKHSDFRVSHINGVKITVLSEPDYEQFVDNYSDLTGLFNIQTTLSKFEFGEIQWLKYVYERSNQQTLIERVLPFNRKIDKGTWTAPTGIGNNQASPISVDLHFGDTIEFEVVYADTTSDPMGDKFKNHRRYIDEFFKWSYYNSDSDSKVTSMIELPTSGGMAAGKFGYQARYTFQQATESQLGVNPTINMAFKPNDQYNNHDNMTVPSSWTTFCYIKPKPVDLTGISGDLYVEWSDTSGDAICTSAGAANTPATVYMSVGGLSDRLVGDSYTYYSSRTTKSSYVTDTNLTAQTYQFEDSIPAPGVGATTEHTYTGHITVNKSIRNAIYQPHSSGYKIDRAPIAQTSFQVPVTTSSGNTNTLKITSVPNMGTTFVTRPWGSSPYTNNTTTAVTDIANQHHQNISQLSPALKSGPGKIGNLRRPSMFIDAAGISKVGTGSSTYYMREMNRFMYFFTQPQSGSTTSLQYYNSNNQWISYINVDNTNIHKSGYATSPFVQVYSENSLNWSTSAAWRVVNSVDGSTCTSNSNTLDVVTVTGYPERPVGVTLSVTYENGNKVQLNWGDTSNKVIEVDSPVTDQYQLKRLFVVDLHNETAGVKLGSFTVDGNELEVSSSSNNSVARLMVPKDKAGVSQVYRFHIRQIWQSTDMYDPDEIKEWTSSTQYSEQFQILDCSDPDLRDVRTGNILKNDSLLTCVGLNDYKKYSSTIQDYEIFGDYQIINPLGCRDYLTEVSCRTAYRKLIADVTCQVTDSIEFEFSGSVASGGTVTLTTANQFSFWNSKSNSRGSASTAMHINMLNDDLNKIYNSQLSMMFDPVLSTTTARKTVLNYFAVLESETNTESGGGNRGEIEITKRENNIVGVIISDPGNNITSGPAHSSVGTNTDSDRYKFKIYATVIDNE